MSVKQSIILSGNRLRESIDSVRWLQAPDAPHNYCDPSTTEVCPNLPNNIGMKRLFKEYQELAKAAPADSFPITSMRPALTIGSSDSFPSLDALPPSLQHLLCYWRVEFMAPRRPLIIDGTLHPPQVVPAPCVPVLGRTSSSFASRQLRVDNAFAAGP